MTLLQIRSGAATGSQPITKRLTGFAGPFWKEITLSVFLSVATTAANIGLMGTSAWLIASAALQPSIAELQVAIVGVRFFGITRGVFRYMERLISHSVNFRLLAKLRGWFFRSIEPLAPGALEDLKSGDLLARSVQDIETLEDFYVRGIAPPISAVIVTAGISLFTMQYSITLSAVLAGGLLLTGLVLSLQIQALSRKRADTLIKSRAQLAALSMETIRNSTEIIMSGAEERHLETIRRASKETLEAGLSHTFLHSFALAAGVLISNLTLVGILYLGIPLIQNGQIDGITLAVIVLMSLASFEPVNLLPAASTKIETSLAAAKRLFDVADRPQPVREPTESAVIDHFSSLTVKNLDYTYSGSETPSLLNISLCLTPGKKIALVGPSGSGKTTLFKVIQHFLEVPEGCVWWNDMDSTHFSGSEIRCLLAVLGQNGYFFSASIKKNMVLASPDSNDDRIKKVLQLSGLTDWLKSNPEGLDYWTGENGGLVSGGERQKLLLARTLLLNRPVLLADEPFSNFDLLSEKRMTRVLLESNSQNACLISTHRLIDMDQFDEILVMDHGRIVQRGTHYDLVSQPGIYRNMQMAQEEKFLFDL